MCLNQICNINWNEITSMPHSHFTLLLEAAYKIQNYVGLSMTDSKKKQDEGGSLVLPKAWSIGMKKLD